MTFRLTIAVLALLAPALAGADEAALSGAFGQCIGQAETADDLRLCKGVAYALCREETPDKWEGACWQTEQLLWVLDGAEQVRLARDWATARGAAAQFEAAQDAFAGMVLAECELISAATIGADEKMVANMACGAEMYAERAIALRLLLQRP